ncbi:CatB-related O-acetyltransferase [Clostridium ljungdahlii]|uniref:Virginiamycin A acetyltransferase n=1 Tax=Clostridium ljungdahlii TaxID=1538 RepID=A0A168NV14_9CLOT|nr:CatB-related O-acetyltransferase [Clostridium ljungdahlii]OAA86944.1 Virginiamycin A acetyltransferase [Clostridium ljungdahlii]
MINKLIVRVKKFFRFLILKYHWRKRNKNNFTYPGHNCNINEIDIGDYTYGCINVQTYGCENAHLTIGRLCSIAQNVKFILGGEHNLNTMSTYPFKEKLFGKKGDTLCKGKIIVSDDVWFGENAVILSGVTIGQGAVIAAGAVVTNSIPPYAVVGGVPAKIIKYRFADDIIKELLKVDYSKLDKEYLRLHIEDLYEPLKKSEQLTWMLKKNN